MYGCERIEHRIIAIPHTQLKYSDGIVNVGHMSIEHRAYTTNGENKNEKT